MKILVLSLLLVIACAQDAKNDASSAEGVLKYDCRNYGCLNDGACNIEEGECECKNGYTEYDCGYKEGAATTGCASCENGGKCQDGKCFCAAGYMGDTCEDRRADVECLGNAMKLVVTPYGGEYPGTIFIDEQEDTDGCSLVAEGDKLTLTLETSACGGATQEIDEETNGNMQSFVAVFSSDAQIKQTGDYKLKFSCIMPANGSLISAEAKVEDIQDNEAAIELEGTVKENIDSPVNLTIVKDGKEIDSPQTLGDSLDLMFSLMENAGFVDSQVQSIEACNGIKDEEGVVCVRVLEDGCPTRGVGSVISKISMEGTTILVSFSVFKFINSPIVNFYTNLTVCASDKCEPLPCEGFSEFRKGQLDLGDNGGDTAANGGKATGDSGKAKAPAATSSKGKSEPSEGGSKATDKAKTTSTSKAKATPAAKPKAKAPAKSKTTDKASPPAKKPVIKTKATSTASKAKTDTKKKTWKKPGRKRRSIDTDFRRLNITLLVRDRFTPFSFSEQGHAEPEMTYPMSMCFRSWSFLMTVVVLLMLALAVIATATFFFLRASKARSKVKPMNE